jgi:hypothetical protein
VRPAVDVRAVKIDAGLKVIGEVSRIWGAETGRTQGGWKAVD